MNIYKFLKPVLPAVMLISTGMFIASCSSSDDSPAVVPPPPPPPTVPTDGITGIWEGTFSRNTTLEQIEYKVTMLFHMPDDPKVAGRGNSGGAAFGGGPTKFDENPHFLFEGGYEYSADPVEAINPQNSEVIISCDEDVWAVGRGGTQGTFMQEFSYETGSAAGPDQRGAGCLYLRDTDDDGYINELTGEINFEQAGKLQVALTYSSENARASSVSDLEAVRSDDVKYHLWTNDNSGTSMAYSKMDITGDTLDIAVVENNATAPSCGGNVKITKVAGHNLFTLETTQQGIDIDTGLPIYVDGCSVSNDPAVSSVDLQYFGFGALLELDDDDNPEFVHLMASRGLGEGATAQALYNWFKLP